MIKWYLTVVLICISIIIRDAEHLFVCSFFICMSLEKCLFRSSVHFGLRFFFCCCCIVWASCIFWKLSPCQLHHLQIFSSSLWAVFLIFLEKKFNYLAVLGLSCPTWNLWSLLQHAGSLVVGCKLLVGACGICFPDQGLKPGSLH